MFLILAQQSAEPWTIALTMSGVFISIIGGLLIFYLKSIKSCVSKQEDRIDKIAESQAACQKDCQRDYVDKVDFIRNVTKTEKTLDSLVKMASEIKGSMKFIEKIPQMCGEIARQITKEMKESKKSEH